MEKALTSQGVYIKPVEISLGTREERRYIQYGAV